MLKVKNIKKAFPDFMLGEISLSIDKGDYFVLLGKSGSGKSLILEIIAGLQKEDSGEILLNNSDFTKTKIQKRNCILVYPDNSLFPHLSVYNNIAFAMKSHGLIQQQIKDGIHQISEFLSITHLLDRKPGNLSSGEAQRVALARALVVKPSILLLDEPLSSLDIQLKSTMISLLRKINKAGQTIIHVTHDFIEAVSLSNKVAVIDEGRIIQQGATEYVFQNPENKFIADLSGLKNFFPAVLLDETNEGLRKAEVLHSGVSIQIISDQNPGEGYIVFGSKDVFLSENKPETSAVNKFKGVVKDVVKQGLGIEVVIDIGFVVCVAVSKSSVLEMKIETGKEFWISFKASACRFIEK